MSPIRQLLNLWQEERGWLILGTLAALLSLLVAVVLMAIAGVMVAGANNTEKVGGALLLGLIAPKVFMRLLVLIKTLARYSERLVTHEATFRILAKLRIWFMKGAIPLSPAKLGNFRSGDLLNRVMADIDALDHFYLRMLLPTIVSAIATLALLFFIGSQNLMLAAISFVAFALSVFVVPWFAKAAAHKPGREIVESTSNLRSQIIDQTQGIAELQIYQGSGRTKSEFSQSNQYHSNIQHRMEFIQGLAVGSSQLISSLLLLGLITVGASLISDGQATATQIALILFVVLAALEVLAPLPTAFLFLGKTEAAAERVV